MSVNAPDWFVTQYETRAMHIYQERGNRLRPTVTPATSFSGSDKARFFRAGKTKARKISGNTTPVPGGGDRKIFEVSLATWQAFDELNQYDLDRLSIDEKEAIYESGAMALGRATDIEIYDVMKAKHTTMDTYMGANLDFSSGAFSAASAMTLCASLQDDKVPWDGNIWCGLPSLQWNQLLANKVVNSSDHVGQNLPFVQATDTRFWNGVNWFLFVEEDAEDLYPVPSSNKQDLFIWHKSAVGWGAHTDLTMIPQWDNRAPGGGAWTFNMQAKGAATADMQDGKGIKRFRTSTNSAIAIV